MLYTGEPYELGEDVGCGGQPITPMTPSLLVGLAMHSPLVPSMTLV